LAAFIIMTRLRASPAAVYRNAFSAAIIAGKDDCISATVVASVDGAL